VTTKQLARVSTLLDEAVEDLEDVNAVFQAAQRTRVITKIREAQAILLGEKPTVPEDN
jgi:hypothetical protein